MSTSRDAVQARLRELLPDYDARQGSQTLAQLANRNNVSRQALEVLAQARARATEQQRAFVKQQEQLFKQQQAAQERAANLQREAQLQYEQAAGSVGDERTRQVLTENGTLSGQVTNRLQAQLQNLIASGEHIDEKTGALTFQAEALQGALNVAQGQSDSDLATRFGGNEQARQAATQQADRNLNAGALANFTQDTINAAGTGFLGLPLQAVAAVAGDTAVGRAAGRGAARVADIAERNAIVTPEEQQFEQDFANSEGFLGGLSTIARNPGAALGAFAPEVVGGLGAGAAIRGVGRAALRRGAPELTERAGQALANSGRFTQASAATAPAVFAAGGSDFVRGAQDALDSETDDIGSFAQRGLATSAIGTAAGGVVGAAGGATLDAPLFRARQALQQPLQGAGTGALSRAGRFTRNVGGEAGRGAFGEGFQEGVEGAAHDISAQLGEGASLSELDLGRTGQAAQLSSAAGFALGGAASGGLGVGTSLARKSEEDLLRAELNQATGSGTEQGINAPREQISTLDQSNIDGTLGRFVRADTIERVEYVLNLAKELNIESSQITAPDVDNLIAQSTVGDKIESTLFRENLGNLLGVSLSVDETGKASRVADDAVANPQVADDAVANPDLTGEAADVDLESAASGSADAVIADPIDTTVTDEVLDDAGAAGEGEGASVPLDVDPVLDFSDPVLDNAAADAATLEGSENVEPIAEPAVEPAESDPQVPDPAAQAQPDTRGVLSDDIEAGFGDIPAIQRLRASNDGSPEAQAREDFEINLLRDQIRNNQRTPGDNRGAGQLQIELLLEQLADQEGIPTESRPDFFAARRSAVADQYRASRDEAIANNAANFQPQEVAAQSAPEPVNVATQEPSFVRDASELNLILDDASPDSALLPQALRTALLGGLPQSTERRGLASLDPAQREALRSQYVRTEDLAPGSDLGQVNSILRGINKAVGNVYKVSAKELREGTGVVPIKRKGTDATRAAAVQKLQQLIPEELAKVRQLLTPEGYQRVFGKKL